MYTQINLFKTLVLLVFLLAVSQLQATEIVDLKPTTSISKSAPPQLAIVEPIPSEPKKVKKKKGWFKRFKEKSIRKKLSKLLPALQFDSLKCDVIVLTNGEEREVRVLEVNTGAVVYEVCDQENGPRRTLLNSKIFMIKYADGYKEVFDGNTDANVEDRKKIAPRKGTWWVGFALGFLLGLVGLLITYVIYMDDRYSRKKAMGGALTGILAILLLYLYLLSII